MLCAVDYIFNLLCAFNFLQPMKNFVFSFASRATGRLQIKPSGSGDENSLGLHCVPSTAHNIATSKMAAVLPTSAKRTNKGRFCRANAADRLTASWFAIARQENERNVRDPKLCSGFSIRGRRVVE